MTVTLPTIDPYPSAPHRTGSNPTTWRAAMEAWVDRMETSPDDFNDFATALNAWRAELITLLSGVDLSGSSTTSLSVGTGTKNLTIETDKQFIPDQFVQISRTSDPTIFMHGQLTAYDSGDGTMSVDVSYKEGTGTYTDWTVTIAVPTTDIVTAAMLATVATTGAYSDLTGKPSLATVATSGAYSDLTGKPTITSGTYSPTISSLTNTDSTPTVSRASYMRVGNIVHVSGYMTIDATAAGYVDFFMSLPIASDINPSTMLHGSCIAYASTAISGGAIKGNTTEDKAFFSLNVTSTASRDYTFQFSYEVA